MSLELSNELSAAVDFARQAKLDLEGARRAIAALDLTSLSDRETESEIAELVGKAEKFGTASVCVAPRHVGNARQARSQNSALRIATVVNFPTGRLRSFTDEVASSDSTAQDVVANNESGANQNDIVLDFELIQKAMRENHQSELDQVGSLLEAAKSNSGLSTLMVIISTAAFDDSGILREACEFCAQFRPDCLKSDTGFHPHGGVTLESAAVMMSVAKKYGLGVKVSAGVRTADNVAHFQTLAKEIYGFSVQNNPLMFRIGASSVLPVLVKAVGLDAAETIDSGY